MLREYIQEYCSLYPFYSIGLEKKKNYNLLENIYSKDFKKKEKLFHEKYKKKLQTLKNKNIYHKSLEYNLNLEFEYYKLKSFSYLILSKNSNLLKTILNKIRDGYIPTKTDKNIKDIIELYRKSIPFVDSKINILKEGIKKKITSPKQIVKIIILQLELLEKEDFRIDIQNKELFIQYNNLIHYMIKPKIKEYRIFLLKEYLPNARETIGLYDVKDGEKMYNYLIRSNLSLSNYTIEYIHEYGKKEVERIEKEMKKIIEKIGFKGGIQNFRESLKKDKSFYFKNGKEIINNYKKWKKKINETIIKKNFNFTINLDFKIKEIPKNIARFSSGAYYILPKGKNEGIFYINTYRLDNNPKFIAESLILHEGNPGHNFQLVRSIEKKVPFYLIYFHSSGYSEGWALYAESLGEYKDLYSYYGRLVLEMMRAVRLVVDTGIHSSKYKWSFEKSLNYFKEKTGIEDFESKNEILRYINNPGQAVSYKMGEKFIMDLRDDFLKKNKSLKEFHSYFLDRGPIPLDLLKEESYKKSSSDEPGLTKGRQCSGRICK